MADQALREPTPDTHPIYREGKLDAKNPLALDLNPSARHARVQGRLQRRDFASRLKRVESGEVVCSSMRFWGESDVMFQMFSLFTYSLPSSSVISHTMRLASQDGFDRTKKRRISMGPSHAMDVIFPVH